jgi:protein tyrosine phosphatase (PTP) superfamily phosphohydrolase (DUF442 family)
MEEEMPLKTVRRKPAVAELHRQPQHKRAKTSERKLGGELFFDPIKEGERAAEISIKAFREALDKAEARK